MKRIVGIPSDGPELLDRISEHFGHCNYFIGIEIGENSNFEKVFSLKNSGHSGCMEPVINMKERDVSEMIIGGIGGRPFIGFLQMGITLYQGEYGTIQENVELLLQGKLEPVSGPSCGNNSSHSHNF
ncbi:MAG: NifB/NifX family molybdenum-iron cluster-binding protein [Promethearchaeota archaeon]